MFIVVLIATRKPSFGRELLRQGDESTVGAGSAHIMRGPVPGG